MKKHLVWAYGVLLALCMGVDSASGQSKSLDFQLVPPPQPTAAASYSELQWEALWDAASHTAGSASFEYQWMFAPDEKQARMNRASALRNAPVQRARSLVEVPVGLRLALSDLFTPNDTSEPFAYTHRGEVGVAVVRLVRRGKMEPFANNAAFKDAARQWVARGLMPPPEELLADPLERARVAYWRANGIAALANVPKELSPNVRFGNHYSPLTFAVIQKKRTLVQGLLERGADINFCSLAGCPLGIAAGFEDANEALEWTRWLLAQGATADTVDLRFYGGQETALSAATRGGHQPVVDALLSAGASVDALPGVRITPLEAAGAFKRKQIAEQLIAKGASVLPWDDRGHFMSRGSLYAAAAETGDADFAKWAEGVMVAGAQKSPQMRFGAFIEQGKRRIEIVDGALVMLQAAPFKLVLVMAPGQAESVMVTSSLNPLLFEELRSGDQRNPVYSVATSAALYPASHPQSYELMVGEPCAPGTKDDARCDGIVWHLNKDDAERADFHEVRSANNEYVREYRSVWSASEGEAKQAKPLSDFAGKTLYVMLATSLALNGPQLKQQPINAKYLRIKLVR